jgi:hypothetical protein
MVVEYVVPDGHAYHRTVVGRMNLSLWDQTVDLEAQMVASFLASCLSDLYPVDGTSEDLQKTR